MSRGELCDPAGAFDFGLCKREGPGFAFLEMGRRVLPFLPVKSGRRLRILSPVGKPGAARVRILSPAVMPGAAGTELSPVVVPGAAGAEYRQGRGI